MENKMNTKDIVIIAVAVVMSCFILIQSVVSSNGRDSKSNVDKIIPVPPPDLQLFAYGSGLTGIYDRYAQTLYVYDSSLKKCVIQRKILKLGDELATIGKDFELEHGK